MGFLVSGQCGCGYTVKHVGLGVGMLTPAGVWFGPFLCRKCRRVVSANVQDKTPECPSCKAKGIEPYLNPDAGKEEGEQYPNCAASEPLFDTRFECPACGKKSLKFEFTGLWD